LVSFAHVFVQAYPNELYFYYSSTDKTKAITFMAVEDPTSGLVSLQLTDGTGQSFISESNGLGGDYSSPSAYSYTYPDQAAVCGTAGTKAAPADGAGGIEGYPCEVFVFGPSLSTTTVGTYDLNSEWVQPGATTATQYYWTVETGAQNSLNQAATTDAYGDVYQVTLQFPV
jgi:hypothetical protein